MDSVCEGDESTNDPGAIEGVNGGSNTVLQAGKARLIMNYE